MVRAPPTIVVFINVGFELDFVILTWFQQKANQQSDLNPNTYDTYNV